MYGEQWTGMAGDAATGGQNAVAGSVVTLPEAAAKHTRCGSMAKDGRAAWSPGSRVFHEIHGFIDSCLQNTRGTPSNHCHHATILPLLVAGSSPTYPMPLGLRFDQQYMYKC